jgi:Galactokinase
MVLATSINLDTIAVSAKNNNDVVRFVSDGYDMITLNINDLEVNDDEAGTTVSLIRGVLRGLKDHGYKIGGFNAYATSDVLVGAGLSSSAAFEVVVGTIISGLYNDMKINSVEIAQISQYAENVFFKKPCGLMDQMACSVGGMVNIDFKDPTKPIVKKVPTEFEKYDYSLCIVDTKGDHVDLTDDYAMIPSEMKKVAIFSEKII